MSAIDPLDLDTIDWDGDDCDRLRAMRAVFLDAGRREVAESIEDYWDGDRDLALYDAVLGERIAWRVAAALDAALARGFAPSGTLVDWGCGSGAAARAVLDRLAFDVVALEDRSALAREFAAGRLRTAHPDVALADRAPERPGLVVASFVLAELDDDAEDALLDSLRAADAVLWVEAGTPAVARRLQRARERLLDTFAPVAPCTHAAACGGLAPAHDADWCHHFAPAPPEAFTTSGWRRASEALGLDLRALPYAYLALARKDAAPARPDGAVRVLGRPRVQKGKSLLDACDADGLRVLELLERTDKRLHRRLRKAESLDLWLRVAREGGRVTRILDGPRETGA